MPADRLAEAAALLAAGARVLASGWSMQIPPSIDVASHGDEAVITATARFARAAELRLDHPLFGNRQYRYPPPGRPFLAPAADQFSDAAAEIYALTIDDLAAERGWT